MVCGAEAEEAAPVGRCRYTAEQPGQYIELGGIMAQLHNGDGMAMAQCEAPGKRAQYVIDKHRQAGH